jgi:hypothetical protein
MIAQALVREHHFDSLDHLHAYGQLSVDTLQRVTDLTLQHARELFGTHTAHAEALFKGQQPSTLQMDSAVDLLQRATQIFTDSYQKWVDLLEAQMDTAHRTAHATYEDLQRWSPAGTEIFLETAELLSDAAERTTEIAAESSAAMVKAVEESTALAATPKTPARRTSTRKTA